MRDGTFRNGSYKRWIFFGKRTVKEGECMAIWLLDGRQKIIEGPRRKRLWCSNIRFLDRHQVDQNQYLVIYHRNGRREHIRGPHAIFENPVLHNKVEIRDVVSIDGFESLVVYKEDEEGARGGKVQRRIVQGPCQFVPDASEWVHEFSWSPSEGSGAAAKERKFTKLRTIPEQLPITAKVRTSNDVVLAVSLMVVFECVDIEKMLDSTGDPVGDFNNSLSADLLAFAAKVSYEKFLELSAEMLNDTSTYPLLVQRAESVGFKIHKVVYRGYRASDEIQQLREARIRQEADMKMEEMQFEKKSSRVKAELDLEEARHTRMLQQREAETKLEEQSRERSNEQQLAFLTQLKNLNVDVTKYLVSLQDRPDRVIRVENNGDDSKKPSFLVNTS